VSMEFYLLLCECTLGSHRDFALPYWQSNEGMMNLQGRGYPINTYSKLALGDL
jgi:hypothetical protein